MTLPLEDPVRVAEDAAVLDALSGGRLQLGVGSGADPAVFSAFGKDVERRREDNTAGVAALVDAFEGQSIRETDFRLQPAAPGLAQRVWQAAFSLEGARYVGAAGSRLLLNRATFGSEGRTDEVQAPWAQAYRAAYTGPADQLRIGLSRGVFPAADKRAAKAAIEQPVLRMAERMIKAGRFPADLTSEEYFERMHISYGSPGRGGRAAGHGPGAATGHRAHRAVQSGSPFARRRHRGAGAVGDAGRTCPRVEAGGASAAAPQPAVA